ncbi:MAG: hypothetical protein ACLQVG_24440 [Terriglobia bacterium]
MRQRSELAVHVTGLTICLVIAKVFALDTLTAAAPATQPQPPPTQPAPQPAAPAAEQPATAEAPPAAIKLGQTIEEVVAILGQPEKIVDLRAK